MQTAFDAGVNFYDTAPMYADGASESLLGRYLSKNGMRDKVVIASKIQLYPKEKYDNGLTLVTCSTRRPTPASLSPAVKSLNYLNNVMAKLEAINGGGEEGLMLNEEGYIAECTGDNIFVIKDGRMSTPPLSAGALNGITRRVHSAM